MDWIDKLPQFVDDNKESIFSDKIRLRNYNSQLEVYKSFIQYIKNNSYLLEV